MNIINVRHELVLAQAEVERLRAEVVRLTRERDDETCRADVTRVVVLEDIARIKSAEEGMERLARERNAARAELDALRDLHRMQEARVAELEAAARRLTMQIGEIGSDEVCTCGMEDETNTDGVCAFHWYAEELRALLGPPKDAPKPCAKCGGDGFKKGPNSGPSLEDGTPMKVPCATCGGRGFTLFHIINGGEPQPCPDCRKDGAK